MKTFAVAFTLLYVIPLSSTTVVVIRTPTHIVVAADSRITWDNNKLPATKGCKILQVKSSDRLVKGSNGIFYASSGFSLELQKQLVQEDVRHASSIAQAADTFSQQGDILARELLSRPQEQIDMFADQTRLGAIFFGIEDGIPKAVWVNFVQVGKDKAKLTLTPHISACPPDGFPNHMACPKKLENDHALAKIGFYDHIEYSMEHNATSLEGLSDQEIALRFVQMEIDHHSQYVSAPIDMMTLTKGGIPYWERNKDGVCSPNEKRWLKAKMKPRDRSTEPQSAPSAQH
jgi:hypothetical protein